MGIVLRPVGQQEEEQEFQQEAPVQPRMRLRPVEEQAPQEPLSEAPQSAPYEDPFNAPTSRGSSFKLRPVEPEQAPQEATPQPPDWYTQEEPITREDILNDPEKMGLIDKALEKRFGNRNMAVSALAVATGAAGARNLDEQSAEERFELWQQWQRSFAGGHTVTTANELAFLRNADEETKGLMGASYALFDKMPNIFQQGAGQAAEGVFEYAKAAIWDPATVLSLGVGKAFASGGARAGAVAMRTAAQHAFKEAIAKGATKAVAATAGREAGQLAFQAVGKRTLMQGAIELGKYTAVDVVANVGTDYAYQLGMIEVGRQDEYSAVQGGIAALGSIAIPSLVAATKGVEAISGMKALQGTIFERYANAFEQFGFMGPDDITAGVKQRVDMSKVDIGLRETLEDFNNNMDRYLSWDDAKVAARDTLDESGLTETAARSTDDAYSNANVFWKSFLFGARDTGEEVGPPTQLTGFIQNLENAGFVFIPRHDSDTVTNFAADAISWLPDETVAKFVSEFESKVGKFTMGESPKTAAELSSLLKQRASDAGYTLAQSRRVADMLNKKPDEVTQGDMLSMLGATPEKGSEKAPFSYGLSVWKRMLTAHPGTTGLNVKGWLYMSTMNNVSDVVHGALKLGEAGGRFFTGDMEGAGRAYRQGKGSILGAAARGRAIMDPNTTFEAADGYFELKPELRDEILRNLTGGVDRDRVLSQYGLNPDQPLLKAGEKGIRTLQMMTGVTIQDELTKKLSFYTAMDQAVMREYGSTFNEFMKRPDAYVEMMSPRFRERVDAWALNRTLRETASKSWSLKGGDGGFLKFAKWIEAASRNPVGGYIIPFGQFMNTSLATFGDYSGFNALKHVIGVGLQGKKVKFHEEEGTELLAKGIVGWTMVGGLMAPDAEEKLEKGLAWNQEERADGSIADVTYDFPLSYLKAVAQGVAHYRRDGAIPESLMTEIGTVLGGQTLREADEIFTDLWEGLKAFGSEDPKPIQNSLEIIGSLTSRIISGATRPLDPINQAAILASDDYTHIDRNQGNKFAAQSLRYVDAFFDAGTQENPQRYDAATGAMDQQDMGRVLGGVRSVPNLTMTNRVMNSIGLGSWQTVQWTGDEQVKNSMNQVIQPMLERATEHMIEQNPDFFDLPLQKRERLFEVTLARAKKQAERMVSMSFDSEDRITNLKKELGAISQKNLGRAMNYLGLEGDPMDLAGEEGGLDKIRMLMYIAENYDEVVLDME